MSLNLFPNLSFQQQPLNFGGGFGASPVFSQSLPSQSPFGSSSPAVQPFNSGFDGIFKMFQMLMMFTLFNNLMDRFRSAGILPQQQQPQQPGTPLPGTIGNSGLTQNDLVNYFLAGSKGGTAPTDERIESRYAQPGSRFATATKPEFDAAIASAYAGQFKAYAMGLDVVFTPGKDVNQLANNLSRGLQAQFTPEAEILSKVAAVYRGELTGVSSTYNNQALRNLLVQWGRSDLANRPGVGVTDVESIGSVVRALNEEQNPQIRQAWLQQIFDFQGNTPNSPSGAVPNLRAYQIAIDIVRGGRLDQLLNSYQTRPR